MALCQKLASWSKVERATQLYLHLLWLDYELPHHDPRDAPQIIAALAKLRKSLFWRERRHLQRSELLQPQGLKAILQAGRREGSMILMQQAFLVDREKNQMLEREILGLRRDLQCALPGPDYMRMLYERVRLA